MWGSHFLYPYKASGMLCLLRKPLMPCKIHLEHSGLDSASSYTDMHPKPDNGNEWSCAKVSLMSERAESYFLLRNIQLLYFYIAHFY